MSYTDAVSRVAQIQAQITSLQTAFDPSVSGSNAAATTTTGTGSSTSSSFADALAQAQGTSGVVGAAEDVPSIAGIGTAVPTTGGGALPSSAQSMLTSDQ